MKLDRVEMLREAGSERGQRTIHDVEKQKQAQATRDRISDEQKVQVDDYREERPRKDPALAEDNREDVQEFREDAAFHNDVFDNGNDNESVFIEAEFETVLEPDFILTARDERQESEREEDDSSHKSDPIIPQSSEEQATVDTRTKQTLTTVGEDEVVYYGIEVQYGRSLLPFTTTQEDESIGPGESVKTEIGSIVENEAEAEAADENPREEVEKDESNIIEETEKEATEVVDPLEEVVLPNKEIEESYQNEGTTVQSNEVTTEAKSYSAKVRVSSVPTKPDDDAAQISLVNESQSSLPSRDATWSFDSTLKRRKTSKIKKKNFTGFTEEDIKNVEDNSGSDVTNFSPEKDADDISKNNHDDLVDAEKGEPLGEEVSVDTNEESLPQDTESEREESHDTDTGAVSDDSNQIVATSSGSNHATDMLIEEGDVHVEKDQRHIDEMVEKQMNESKESQPTENDIIADTSNDVVPLDISKSHEETSDGSSESQEFDAILENVAELIENSDWDAFVAAVTARPSLATLSSVDFFPSECTGFLAIGASDNLLLHEVCKNEPSAEAVATLIEVHDAAVKTVGQWGYLPIHCACASGASEDVIRKLLEAHPESIETFGDDKMFPLHLACKRKAPMGVFELLLGAYPPACAVKDVYEMTPMDYVMSEVDGSERTKKLELLSSQVQIMYLSTADLKFKLRESEEKSMSIRKELVEKRKKVIILEKDLKELRNKTLSVEGDLKEKQERTSDLGEELKAKQEQLVELEKQLGFERAKASVFGDNLKKELAKTSTLEVQLREERITSSNLAKELKSNADEWSVLGAEMEEEFKKSAAELIKERRRIATLENMLRNEQEKSTSLERQLGNQRQESTSRDDFPLDEREETPSFEDKLAAAKVEWLLEKQVIYEKASSNLAEAYQMIEESQKALQSQSESNEIINNNDVQMVDGHDVLEEMKNKLEEKHVTSLMERQKIYEKVDDQFAEAYKILYKTEDDLKEERTKWLIERQAILEKNCKNMAEAYKILSDTEVTLAEKKNKLLEYEGMLDEHQKEIQQGQDKSKSLVRQLELANAVSGEKLSGLVHELNIQKSFSESQSKQIEALESSIDHQQSDTNEFTKEQQERLAYEQSVAEEIMKKIDEKKRLMKENQEMISVLEKSNLMKQELLEAQQKKVEALESGRREKEAQLKLNQQVMKQLEESIAEKQALEKEEMAQASKLAGTRASRKAAIDIEEDQIKELDYTLARKQALIELEKMKEATLQQTIAQKRELIQSEVTRIKELELLIEEKQMHLKTERDSTKALKAAMAEKDALITSERKVVDELRRTQEEKERILQAQAETEALIQSHVKEEQCLLAEKQAAIEGMKEARVILETELENQKKTTSAIENQIVKKKNLITKEEYVAKCLHQMSLHKRELMPPGAVSYFVNAYLGMQFTANNGMKFLLKETHLVSNFIKTHFREQSAAIRKRRDEALAIVPRAIRQRRDEALAIVPSIPAVTVPALNVCKTVVTKGPRSLLARLRSYGVNVDLFPKNYGEEVATPEKKKLMPESKLPKWKKKDSE